MRFSRNHVFQIWETFFSKSAKPISVNQNFFDTLYKKLVNKTSKKLKKAPHIFSTGVNSSPKQAFFRTFYKIAYKAHTNIKN